MVVAKMATLNQIVARFLEPCACLSGSFIDWPPASPSRHHSFV